MRVGCIVLLCSSFAVAATLPAGADPKGPKGEKCQSSETNSKHDIKGVHYTCDKCVYLKCDTSTKELKNCTSTTYWDNCVEVPATPPKKK